MQCQLRNQITEQQPLTMHMLQHMFMGDRQPITSSMINAGYPRDLDTITTEAFDKQAAMLKTEAKLAS